MNRTSRPKEHIYEVDDNVIIYWRDVKKLKWSEVADFLCVPLWWLEKHIASKRLTFKTKKVSATYDRHYPWSRSNLMARRLGYKDVYSAIREMRMGEMTVKEVAEKLKVTVSTVNYHTPRDLIGEISIVTEKKRESARQSIRKAQVKAWQRITNETHPWQTR
jgi:hypothetical protein